MIVIIAVVLVCLTGLLILPQVDPDNFTVSRSDSFSFSAGHVEAVSFLFNAISPDLLVSPAITSQHRYRSSQINEFAFVAKGPLISLRC
jgi:hypothetical protein